jgi:hypothetical protein
VIGWARLLWGAAALTALAAVLVAILLGHLGIRAPGRPTTLYRHHFSDPRRERLFLSSASFFVTFLAVRALAHSIRLGIGPFADVRLGGVHVHHLVWGILLLLGIGYCWLIQVGTGTAPSAPWTSQVTATLYGVGAALTLDEFALWLRLEDVYWSPEGQASVEAVLLFGAVLSLGLWGGPFLHALVKETAKVLKH